MAAVATRSNVLVRCKSGALLKVRAGDHIPADVEPEHLVHLLAVGLAEEAPGKPAQDEKPAPRRRSQAN